MTNKQHLVVYIDFPNELTVTIVKSISKGDNYKNE